MNPPGPPALAAIAARFLRAGALAWGGPVVQIGALHDEFVVRDRWVPDDRFRRALALYQALPGPEATELCIWLGTVARGRLGGLIAGACFVLPGLLLMLLASSALFALSPWPNWLLAAFGGMQAVVVALVVRATWRLASVARLRQPVLGAIALATAIGGLAHVPFAISLLGGGALATAAALPRRLAFGASAARGNPGLMLAVAIAWLGLAVWLRSAPVAAADTLAGAASPSMVQLLLTGLRGGLLSFGGAYTVIPFLQADATGAAGWMTQDQFVSGLALGSVLPAPMVIAGTWVGWAGGGLPGALLLTLGIFLPAFVFPLLLHPLLERLAAMPRLRNCLDGVTAAVVGLIAATSGSLVAALPSLASAGIAIGALILLQRLRARAAVVLVMIGAAALGIAQAS
jgi:chromate transporter